MGLLHTIKTQSMGINDVIYSEGDSPECVYFIKQGEVELSKLCCVARSESL